jgi:hypothetical protein
MFLSLLTAGSAALLESVVASRDHHSAKRLDHAGDPPRSEVSIMVMPRAFLPALHHVLHISRLL